MISKSSADIRKGQGYGYLDSDGAVYLFKCFECGQENWAVAVASGECAWCGYDAKEVKNEAEEIIRRRMP